MNNYVTANTIKALRCALGMTQNELAEKLSVSDKAVSKWETGKGLPDISLIEPLCKALQVSVAELLSGDVVENKNRSSNLKRSVFYVCPVCGNVLEGNGEATVSCCGITLPPLEAEAADEAHRLTVTPVEDEHYITCAHPMTKEHFISFLCFVSDQKRTLVKLYPEGECETRLNLRGGGILYHYCNRHGLFKQKV